MIFICLFYYLLIENEYFVSPPFALITAEFFFFWYSANKIFTVFSNNRVLF